MSESKPGSIWNLLGEVPRDQTGRSSLWNLILAPETAAGSEPPAPCAVRFQGDQVYWALRNLPAGDAPKHFLICGMIGSGKTTTIQLFLQSIAPRFRPGWSRPEQLIVFDAKCDVVPLLATLGLRPEDENVWILNPYDARSAVWDLGDAIRTPVMARHLATLLVPEERNSTAPFFSDAARELVRGVLLALNRIAGPRWTLRDLLCALESKDHIAAVTAHHPRAKRLAAQVLNDERHALGVLSTLATKIGPFEQVAALWHSSPGARRFSITEFLKRPGVLVLGNDPVLRESLWPLNAILLKALAQEILRRPNTPEPRHWFVLDEFRAMERVDCIHELLNRGRSKGASVLIGVQSVEGLVEVYGEQAANDILSMCGHKTFLRAGGPKTAEWAEKFFGRVRRTEPVITEGWGPGGPSCSVQYNLQDRPLLLGSFFLDLPFPGRGKPYVAVCDVPSQRSVLIVRRPFNELLDWCLQPAEVPAVVPRTDAEGQTLWPWTEDEEQAFCREPDEDQAQETKSTEAPRKTTKPGARRKRRRQPPT